MRRLSIGVLSALLGALAFAGITWQPPAQAISPVSWLNNSLFAPVPGLGNLNDGLYADFTKGTLVPERGPTFGNVRATGSSTVDNEGLVRTILSGEARFWRLRRVGNLHSVSSENFSHASWTKTTATLTAGIGDPNGGTSAYTFTANGATSQVFEAITVLVQSRTDAGSIWIKRRTGAGAVQLITAAGGRQAITVTSSWRRYSHSSASAGGTIYWGVELATSGDEVDIAFSQIENITGQSITAPSEYVSKGVLSTPFHGAGVDGVKYFNTANGNTVASNVVTEATGAPLTVTSSGIWPNGAHTNICLQSEDFGTTWAALAATSPTRVAANVRLGDLVLDLIGDDSAVLAEGYTQTIAFTGNAVKAVSIHMKQGTTTNSAIRLRDDTAVADRLLASIAWSGGVPTVTMTTGTLESTETLANGVYRFNFTTTSVTAANTNRLEVYPASNAALDVTATGTVNAGGVQAENATTNGRYVKTTTASVAVNADVITASGATVINQTEGTLWVQAIAQPFSTATAIAFDVSDGTINELHEIYRLALDPLAIIVDGGATQANIDGGAWSNSAVGKAAFRYKLNDSNIAFGGAAGAADTACTMPTTTGLYIGQSGGATSFWNSPIQKVALSRTGASDAQLAQATTP